MKKLFFVICVFAVFASPCFAAAGTFISSWDSTKAGSSTNHQITLPLTSEGTYNFTVNWGDGSSETITAWNQPGVTHSYVSTGVYTLNIDGTIEGFSFNNAGDKLKITKISQWGTLNLGNSTGYFYGCTNLKITATDILDLTGTTDMTNAFASSGIDTVPSMNSWDVSKVTNMNSMFNGATLFTQNISSWDVSSVTNMYGVFASTAFNQPIGNWNISNVTNLGHMFDTARSFNQPIGNWNTSNVTNMGYMFTAANSFNQPIGNWDTSNDLRMDQVFSLDYVFNQDIGNWNVSKVWTMSYMFWGDFVFNNGGSASIGNWNTSSVTNMSYIFREDYAFNQPIGNWNVSNVTNMMDLLTYNYHFNQDISKWDVSKVTTIGWAFYGVPLSTINYSKLLVGWSARTLQHGVAMSGGTFKYYTGAPAAAWAVMTGTYGWGISDGGSQEPIAFNDAASGNWNDGPTWGHTTSEVEGTDYPGPYDSAAIDSNIVTLSANQSVANITVAAGGTLTGSNHTLNVSGNWNNTGGAFTDGTSTVNLTGTGESISGSNTFYNLTCSTAGKTLTFDATSIQTVEGALTLTGTSGSRIKLRCSSSPAQWKINPSGTRSVSYVDVMDSDNINASNINADATNTDSGNNTNWFAPPSAPSGFTASSGSVSGLSYTWTNNSTNESGFRILDETNATKATAAAGAASTSEIGLSANTQYTRKVQAFNAYGVATSDAVSRYTSIEAATGATWEGITTSSITIHSTNDPSNLSLGSSGIYFENATLGTNSGWIQSNGWTSPGLTANASYTFRITARNGDGVVNPSTLEVSTPSSVSAPAAKAFSSVTTTVINANWDANGNPATVEYYCENTTNSTNSGWITALSWTSSSLEASTIYNFRVKARIGSAESDWAALGTQETMALAPADASMAGVSLKNGDTISSTPTITISFSSETTVSSSSLKPLATLGGIKSVQVNGVDVGYDIISQTDTSITIKLRDALSAGTHDIKIISYDTAGTDYVLEKTGLIVSSGAVTTSGPTLVYPNPYDPLAGNLKITYYLSVDTDTTIYIIDMNGRLVWKSNYTSGSNGGKAGYNEVVWNSVGMFGQLASGAYIINVIEQGTGKQITKTKLMVWKGGAASRKPSNDLGFAMLSLFVLLGLTTGVASLKMYDVIRKMKK